MRDKKPIVFDDDNPEWTDADFARAKRAADALPAELVAALVKNVGGRSSGSSNTPISIRLDQDVIDRFKADGAGWQERMNDALRKAAGL